MPTEKLNSDHAKEKHGELMITVAASIFIGIFSVLFDPSALKAIENSNQSTFVGYLILWGVMGAAAISLMNEGLKRIDRAHSNREPLIPLPMPNMERTPDDGNGLNIAINHGNTQITISIK